MPEPLIRGRRYMPGLDGLRALAVLAVIAYHLGFGWASGGLLGVAVFFTLSGYLITDLLLGQYLEGRLRLGEFWLARARRLLPALFVMLLVVSVWVWADDRAQLATVRGEVIGGLLYISNWWQSFQHVSYFARFGAPSPLNHLWSLAVEEQFYIFWPWILLIAVRLVGRPRSRPARRQLALLILILAAGSALEMALLFHPGFDPTRVYTGTDTRAFGLLIGAALACVWPSRTLYPRGGPQSPWVIDLIGCVGLVGVGVLIFTTSEYSPFIYHGGLVLASIFSAMAVAALSHPASRLADLVGCGPLRWLGVRSYGLYLWHEPVIVLTTPNANMGVEPLRAALQVLGAIAIAAFSWRFIEEPIRHGALGRSWRRLMRYGRPGLRGTFGVSAFAAASVFATLGLTGAIASPPLQPVVSSIALGPGGGLGTGAGSGSSPGVGSGRHPAGSSRGDAGATHDPPAGRHHTSTLTTSSPTGSGAGAHLRTSCTSVVHIGDSTSEGLVSNDYLPDPRQQIPAQYRRVGVRHPIMEITGGTSIVETLPGDVDARAVADTLVHHGYDGCWVIALGTNDVADVAVGSNVSLGQRIEDMMKILHGQPVMWVNVKTLVASGPYAESNMLKWNAALVSACRRYPNMRVYDWAGAVQNRWFIPDGIHYYSPGYAARAHLIADALAEAFPYGRRSPSSCVVSTPSLSIPVLGIAH